MLSLKSIRLVLTVTCLGLTTVAQAGGIVADVSGGSGNTAYDAKATFTFGNKSLAIDMVNNIVNPNSVIQNVSAVSFTLANSGNVGTYTSYKYAGNTEQISNHGVVSGQTAVSYNKGDAGARWFLSSPTSSSITLDDLGGSQPHQTLIGSPDILGVYSNAGGSIAGNVAHNPFLYGDALYTLDYSGFTAGTKLESVTFQFGTADGLNQYTVTNFAATPEPSTLVMLGAAALGGFGYALRRRARARVQG